MPKRSLSFYVKRVRTPLLWYFALGVVVFFLRQGSVHIPSFDGTFWRYAVVVYGFLLVLIVTLLGIYHPSIDFKWYDALRVPVGCFVAALPMVWLISFINAFHAVGPAITYSGPVLATYRCKEAPGHRIDPGDLFYQVTYELTTPYCIQLRDESRGQTVVLEVNRRTYEQTQPGQFFTCIFHRGWLGIPYRWAYE
jgi:hypothetical protein